MVGVNRPLVGIILADNKVTDIACIIYKYTWFKHRRFRARGNPFRHHIPQILYRNFV